ncbi:MAG: hypothetical protein HOV87_27770 [Catenulispora sp.]|nr:hypothetical protein [Catenulispora sp.]
MTRRRRGLAGLATGPATVLGTVLATGLTAAAVLAAGVATAAAADTSGPTATPPTTPAVQTVTGVATNGVQLTLTLPKQLPVDLPAQTLAGREVDVTVKDIAGQGYTGEADTTFTAQGGSVTRTPLRIERYDPDSGAWRPVAVSPGAGAALTVPVPVTVPADGTQQVRLRVSPGTTLLDSVKVSASANGATVVGSAPVTSPAFSSTGLTAAVKAGTPQVVTGRLTNPTDVDYLHVPVKLYLKACSTQTGFCLQPADVKLEAQFAGQWQQVPVAADPAVAGGVTGTLFPDVSLSAGDSVQLTARMTLNSGSTAVSPVPVGFGPMGLTIADREATGGTLTVQPAVSPTPTTPATSTVSSSSSASTSSSSPSATPSTSDSASDSASVSTSDGASATGTASATTPPATAPSGPTASPVAAGTPSASGSGSDTILVAVGLFAVCLALVLVWALIKRRERAAAAVRAFAGPDGVDGEHDDIG